MKNLGDIGSRKKGNVNAYSISYPLSFGVTGELRRLTPRGGRRGRIDLFDLD